MIVTRAVSAVADLCVKAQNKQANFTQYMYHNINLLILTVVNRPI